ncbi:hypothetical protein RND81_08G166500 [Saponaria officinalis]|uniref:X8 domain-containing protein n=1 Tax=Saponaria officinalis TaxID=3572 RepID=A0AAW1J8A2_SAPOF
MSRVLSHLVFTCFFLLFAKQILLAEGDCKYCATNMLVTDQVIQGKLDYVCGQNPSLCDPIKEGGPCYVAKDLRATASYAFNAWYVAGNDCNLEGAAILTASDMSHDACKFACR